MKEKLVNLLAQKQELKQGDVLSTLLFNRYINDLPNVLNKEINNEEDQLHARKLDNVDINNLLFVIDLTKLSWSKYDLLKKISNLENYCEKLGLELNFDKTKVMVFNKKGSTVKHEHKYTYLGFTFIPSGRKHKGIENLLKNV